MKKLTLKKEVLRQLDMQEAQGVNGGTLDTNYICWKISAGECPHSEKMSCKLKCDNFNA